MKFLRKFNEMEHTNEFDNDKILKIMKSDWGWEMGILQWTDDYENNPEYYQSPSDENDYVIGFNKFLIDKLSGRLIGSFRKDFPLRGGTWQIGPTYTKPTSIYNKLT